MHYVLDWYDKNYTYTDDLALVRRLFTYYDGKRGEFTSIANAIDKTEKRGETVYLRYYDNSSRVTFGFEYADSVGYSPYFGKAHDLLNQYYSDYHDCPYNIKVTDDYIRFTFHIIPGLYNKQKKLAYLLYARCPIDTLQSRFPDFAFPSRFQIPPKHLETDTGSFIITYDTPPDADKWFYKIDEGWYVVSP